MAVREPRSSRGRPLRARSSTSYSVTGATPPFAREVAKLLAAGGGNRQLVEAASRFRADRRYVGDLRDLQLDLEPLLRWTEGQAGAAFDGAAFDQFLQDVYGNDAATLTAGNAFGTTAERLADTLVADMLADSNVARSHDDVVHAIKLLSLLKRHADGDDIGPGTVGALVAGLSVVIPELDLAMEPPEPTPEPTPQEPPADRGKELRDRLRGLEDAHRELRAALRRTEAVDVRDPGETKVTGTPGREEAARIEAVLLRFARLQDIDPRELSAELTEPSTAATLRIGGGTELRLSGRVLDGLSDTVKSLGRQLVGEIQDTDPYGLIATIEEEMATIGAQLADTEPRPMHVMLSGAMLDLATLRMLFPVGKLDPTLIPTVAGCEHKAGVSDLLIVRQTLKAYQLGEFAHVENVLRGEFREREHRRLNLREDITVEETERETTKERDLQSTERFEMQSEAERVVRSQFQLEAGLQVSGSYGPAVSFSASLNTGFSTSMEDTQRKAVNYSREVTERSSERIRERVREERRRRVLEQIEEINLHRIDNATQPDGHVRGIYRWLNKLYDAQVLNYGKRMMYEFVIPEPAAFFLWAMVENPPTDATIEKPDPPTFGGALLKPENLSRTNYQRYVARYEAKGVKPPPSAYTNVAFFEKQEGKEENHYERAAKLQVPEGYEATGANIWAAYTHSKDTAAMSVAVGGYAKHPWGYVTFGPPFRGEISVLVHAFQAWSFVVGIDVGCRLTTEGFAKWQIQTYDSIMEAYLDKKAAYEERLAALAIQQGPQILGRNPLENVEIIRAELKKLVVMLLRRSSWMDFNSFYGGAEPYMNLWKVCDNGAEIRFFENAFEWRNLLYVLYPYFWGRKSRWTSALHLTDPDPDFSAFLRAGAARVQVPVRPGFERAVAYYAQRGQIWEGDDPPLVGDDLYVPIIQEITESLGKIEDGVPYPEGSEPWEVTVPTSLVVLQDLKEIPEIRDVLTDQPIGLGGSNA
jgi:hypothetical protein